MTLFGVSSVDKLYLTGMKAPHVVKCNYVTCTDNPEYDVRMTGNPQSVFLIAFRRII